MDKISESPSAQTQCDPMILLEWIPSMRSNELRAALAHGLGSDRGRRVDRHTVAYLLFHLLVAYLDDDALRRYADFNEENWDPDGDRLRAITREDGLRWVRLDSDCLEDLVLTPAQMGYILRRCEGLIFRDGDLYRLDFQKLYALLAADTGLEIQRFHDPDYVRDEEEV